jgi:hypothetical protein
MARHTMQNYFRPMVPFFGTWKPGAGNGCLEILNTDQGAQFTRGKFYGSGSIAYLGSKTVQPMTAGTNSFSTPVA